MLSLHLDEMREPQPRQKLICSSQVRETSTVPNPRRTVHTSQILSDTGLLHDLCPTGCAGGENIIRPRSPWCYMTVEMTRYTCSEQSVPNFLVPWKQFATIEGEHMIFTAWLWMICVGHRVQCLDPVRCRT